MAQRHAPGEEIRLLRGRSFRRLTPAGPQDSLIDSAEAFLALLKREYDLDLPEAAGLWPKVVARHEALFAKQPA